MNTPTTISRPGTENRLITGFVKRLYKLVFLVILTFLALNHTIYAGDLIPATEDTTLLFQAREKLNLSRDTLSKAPEVSLSLVNEISGLINNSGDSLLRADLLYLKGKIYSQMGDYAKAIENLKESAVIYSKKSSNNKYAESLNYLGTVYDNLGDYDTALRHYLLSLNALDESNPTGLVYAHNNIALIHLETYDYTKARTNLEKAIKIAKRHELKASLTYPYHNLGDLHSRLENYDSALYYYEQSYLLDTLADDVVGIGLNLKAMAEVYKELEAYSKAESHLEEALVHFQESNDKFNLAATYSSLGEVFLKKGQYQKASSYASKGLSLGQEILAKKEIKHAAGVLSKIHKAQKKFEQALQFAEMYDVYKDSLFNEAKNREMAILQLQQAEAEKDQLQVDNEIKTNRVSDQQLLIEKQTYIVIFVTFGLIISVVIMVILNNANRDKKIANGQLVAQKKEIENIITKLKGLNRSIEDQKNQLEETNRVKDKLISIISHDFRSPLNSLEGVLVLFSNGQISNSEMRPIAHDLRLKVSLTTSLIDNLLNWAKNQMQGISPYPESFDIFRLSEETIRLVELQAENKGVEIKNEVSKEDNPQVYADYEMIKLVLRNLLSNAIKFTARGGQVVIRTIRHEKSLSIYVKDSGVGMKEDQLNNIFTNQTTSTLGTSYEKGTGLGLMLCKDFVEKNGGQISVQSRESEGSTFSFTIPIDKTIKLIDPKKKNELKHA